MAVVALPGVTPAGAGLEPVPKVIEAIEDLLVRAKRGEIRAIGAAFVEPRGSTGITFGWHQDEPTGNALAAALSYLQFEYLMRQNAAHHSIPRLSPDPEAS